MPSAPLPNQRVGDAEREAAVEELRAHMVAGRLTLDEFDDRMAYALQAKTAQQLEELFDDLPDDPNAVAGVSVWRAPPRKRPPAASPLRVAQRWMIILVPVLWVTVFTGWTLWWLLFVVWGAVFVALTVLERRLAPPEIEQ